MPQGTVLGPILFTLYIDGIFSVVEDDLDVCNVDDTAILIKCDT